MEYTGLNTELPVYCKRWQTIPLFLPEGATTCRYEFLFHLTLTVFIFNLEIFIAIFDFCFISKKKKKFNSILNFFCQYKMSNKLFSNVIE